MNQEKIEAISTAREWLESNSVIVDTETTGFSSTDEVIEIAAIDTSGAHLFFSRVKPKNPIPEEAQRYHKITNTDVAFCPTWPDLHERIEALLRGRPIIAYNSDYDSRLINQSAMGWGLQPIWADWKCAMKLFARFYQEPGPARYQAAGDNWKWQKLIKAVKFCKAQEREEHRAINDCLMTLDVLKYMASQLKENESER